ncbi:MAG: enoyl-CoA hydratase-related protein [Gammaproteobacteria bacterium]|nr:enoyl-CoA hydratase-related protein [Gammaproteobacteria bacterium]MDH3534433.1 enoyl-CoA hydratase-related protein [Gammaproteobacteria bacterium]
MNQEVRVASHDQVVEITIDRPPANAINPGVSNAIYEALTMLQDDDDLRVGIITGGGNRIFSAGWDLKEIAAIDSNEAAVNSAFQCPGGFAGISEFWGLRKPVIAAINGIAVGGGFEIALSCDLIVAADHVEFFLPEMQRGFLPDVGAVQILPRRVPYNVAMDLLYTGRRMGAAEARRWGLVSRVCAADALMDTARALARDIARGAPLALQALKEVVPAIYNLPLPDAFAATKPGNDALPIYQQMLMSEDFMEGPRAFAEKRDPVWKGK